MQRRMLIGFTEGNPKSLDQLEDIGPFIEAIDG